jgi:hypothetical protein
LLGQKCKLQFAKFEHIFDLKNQIFFLDFFNILEMESAKERIDKFTEGLSEDAPLESYVDRELSFTGLSDSALETLCDWVKDWFQTKIAKLSLNSKLCITLLTTRLCCTLPLVSHRIRMFNLQCDDNRSMFLRLLRNRCLIFSDDDEWIDQEVFDICTAFRITNLFKNKKSTS